MVGGDEREARLRQAAELFNARDLDAVLDLFDPMVEWPDLMDDKLLWGRAAIRDYWERQMLVAVPMLTPIEFVADGDDLIMVSTQEVKDRATGEELIPTTTIAQRYSFRDGLVSRMRLFGSLEDALAAEESP